MKKYLLILIGVFILFIVESSCSQKILKENPYGLDLITSVSQHKLEIKKDSIFMLIDLEEHIPGLVLDIRYATKNNFTKQKLYKKAKAYARKPVADSLLKIQNELNKKGLGLKIFDAYRPYAITLKFYRIYNDTNFVASPWRGSSHNTGCAVDLTIIDLKTGKELIMPTEFDDFTGKAAHSYMNLPERVIRNRKLLKDIMIKYGFVPYSKEWWHYRYKSSKKFGLIDLNFKELEQSYK